MLGVFDSGLGGLTVLRELRNKLPETAILYFGDTARVPYGSKGAETIKKYAQQDAEWLLRKGADAIVIACHTAASVAGADLRSKYKGSIPVFDVVQPGIDKALEVTDGHVGVAEVRRLVGDDLGDDVAATGGAGADDRRKSVLVRDQGPLVRRDRHRDPRRSHRR